MAKGVVSRISAKAWNGRDGEVTLYSFVIEGDRTWYRTGTKKPPFVEGQMVEFTANGQNVEVESITVSQGAPAQAAPTVQSSAPVATASAPARSSRNWGGGGGASARDKYFEDKNKRDIEVVEPRITYSSSQRDAIAVVDMALRNDALVLGNSAKGERLGLILAAIDEVTARFVKQRNGEEVPSPIVKKKAAKAEEATSE